MKCQCGHPRDEHYEEGRTMCDRDGCACEHYQPDPAALALEDLRARIRKAVDESDCSACKVFLQSLLLEST